MNPGGFDLLFLKTSVSSVVLLCVFWLNLGCGLLCAVAFIHCLIVPIVFYLNAISFIQEFILILWINLKVGRDLIAFYYLVCVSWVKTLTRSAI